MGERSGTIARLEGVSVVKRCTVDGIGMKITGEDAQPLIDALNEYLSAFVTPKRTASRYLIGRYKSSCNIILTWLTMVSHANRTASRRRNDGALQGPRAIRVCLDGRESGGSATAVWPLGE